MSFDKATQVRIGMGKNTEQEIMDYLEEHPDKTIYELSKELDWKVGKIQKALIRLGDQVDFTKEVGDARIKKKYRVSNSD